MAVLAASASEGRPLPEMAAEMVRIGEELEPRATRLRFREPYTHFVDELQARGWLDPAVADHSRRRAAG